MMPSRMPRDALPVLMAANSRFRVSWALCILSSAFLISSFTIAVLPPGDQRPQRLARHDLLDIAGNVEIEDDDGKAVVHAEGDGRRVHDLEVLLEHLEVGEAVILHSGTVLHRVRAVDAVHLGG